MISRRWLLSASVAASLGLGVFSERNQLEARLAAFRRRMAAIDPRSSQPETWSETPPPSQVTITIDPTSTHAISPLIYGLAHANPPSLQATGARLNRWGGNPNSRYNWAHGSAWNAARDWEFRNYGEDSDSAPGPSRVADAFVAANRGNAATTWLTVPALGWVARDGDTNHRSIDVPPDGGAPTASKPDAIPDY